MYNKEKFRRYALHKKKADWIHKILHFLEFVIAIITLIVLVGMLGMEIYRMFTMEGYFATINIPA